MLSAISGKSLPVIGLIKKAFEIAEKDFGRKVTNLGEIEQLIIEHTKDEEKETPLGEINLKSFSPPPGKITSTDFDDI